MAGMSPPGKRRWAIAEGYLPKEGHLDDPELMSHETACILNAGTAPAHITLTMYFSDREPAGPYHLTVPARRTLHLRFNELQHPEAIPRGTDYATLLESDVPVVVQHTRLDSRSPDIALMSTVAFGTD